MNRVRYLQRSEKIFTLWWKDSNIRNMRENPVNFIFCVILFTIICFNVGHSQDNSTLLTPILTTIHSVAYEGEDWSNAIDGDIAGWDGTMTDASAKSFAVFGFENNTFVTLNKIRFLTDTGVDYKIRWAKQIELSVSTTDTISSNFTVVDTLILTSGDWQEFELENILAKYVRIEILVPRSGYKQIGEIEFYGEVLPNEQDISVSDTTIDFGVLVFGNNETNNVTLANNGFKDLLVTDIQLVGNNAADFAFDVQSPPFTIAGASFMNLPIIFFPQSVGFKEAQLQIASDDPDEPLTVINLSGFSKEKPILVAPANNSIVGTLSPQFSWQVPNDETDLHFIVDFNGSNGTTLSIDSRTAPELFDPAPPYNQSVGTVNMVPVFTADERFTWSVKAFDGSVFGPSSDVWEFDMDSVAPSNLSLQYPDAVFDNHWINSQINSTTNALLTYTDQNASTAILQTVGLGGPYDRSNIPIGTNQSLFFNLNLNNVADGEYELSATVADLAGHESTIQSVIGVDKNPPVGTLASVRNDTSSTTTFTVNWGDGSDGNGSGLSGTYKIHVKVDNGPWVLWLDKVTTMSAPFNGQDLHAYAFEAAAYDNLGHLEALTGTAEANIYVDRTANDVDPPSAPQSLTANGKAVASPWQTGTEYDIEWQNPVDEVQIISSYYKIGSPPNSNADYDEKEDPDGPIKIVSEIEDGVPFYLWLEDRSGNVDYNKYATVLLRRDKTNPIVINYLFDKIPHFVDGNSRNWYNSNNLSSVNLAVNFSEKHANKATLQTGGFSGLLENTSIPSGTNVSTPFSLVWQTAQTGSFNMNVSITDSAGLTAELPVPFGLDGIPPTGSIATSVDVSATESFVVQWGQGDDGAGSGLAGQYDIYVKVDNSDWQLWHDDFMGTSSTYLGQHGHSYAFQSLAIDYVGNVEELLPMSETATVVDTTDDDIAAPPPPINLTAGGTTEQSPWQVDSSFVINWENPFDESGIVGSFWKLGDQPRSNTDYDSEGPVNGPISVVFNQEGQAWLYVWLVDTKGNVNYLNYGKVLLRRNLEPRITDLRLTNPNSFYIDDENRNWYDHKQDTEITVQLTYSEIQTDSIVIRLNGNQTLYKTETPGNGEQVVVRHKFSIQDYVDGLYTITASVYDIGGLFVSEDLLLGLDSTAPTQAIAFSPLLSTKEQFIVSWSKGIDEGAGTSNKFRIYYQDNDGIWKIWINETTEFSAEFFGQDLHQYGFEVITWDNLQHSEVLTQTAETTTLINLSAGDTTAPAKPINLIAGGNNPSPWQSNSTFKLSWTNPEDLSGVAKSYYKLGDPPTSNTDISGGGGAANQLDVNATIENGQDVYVWLEDANGNVDYRNNAVVKLKLDKTLPEITNKRLQAPMYGTNWYDQTQMPSVDFRLDYRERHLDSLIVTIQDFSINKVIENPESGLDIKVFIPLDVDSKVDGSGLLKVTMVDSAGNRSTVFDTLHLDSTPPMNTKAVAPEISSSTNFIVNWTKGQDLGVGVSGFYDVWVNENGKGWEIWNAKINSRFAEFTGLHNNTYQFEALAYDYLGNLEKRLSFAEAATTIDTTASDTLAPLPPQNINVAGLNPSGWQKQDSFDIDWDGDADPTGITKSFYKLGLPPTSNEDFANTGPGAPPLKVRVQNQDGQWCHVWLADGNNNVDYQNYSSILLRWDATAPVIDSLNLALPAYGERWFNPKVQGDTELMVHFTEKHVDSVVVNGPSLVEINSLSIPSNAENYTNFSISFPDSADTTFFLSVAIIDSVGNRTDDSTKLSLDSTPPYGTIANSPDTTSPGEFAVTWGGAQTDGFGSGLSGEYYVKIRIDDGEWEAWNPRINATQATFIGEAGHIYAFEAAAFDNVGNLEKLTGIAETQTIVKLNFWDKEAPGPPIDLIANANDPGDWSNNPVFEMSWQAPEDPSGIAKSYFKIGETPQNNDDYTASGAGNPPVAITVENEGLNDLYVWLEDGNGNRDFLTAEKIVLRYDATPPVIDSLFVFNANYSNHWLNPDSTDSAIVRIIYSESFADTVSLFTGSILGELFKTDIVNGPDQFIDFQVPIIELNEGCYKLYSQIEDSAGNTSVDSINLCIDGAPPDSAWALSVSVSQTPEFTISWANEGKGNDGLGSGLSGEYDVRIKIDNGAWYDLLKRERKTSMKYVGNHGSTYGFEVAAWDNVGNREPFFKFVESQTLVDTAFIDITAPPAPISIQVNSTNPGGWQNKTEFEITWENPVDESGISHVYYKLDLPPSSPNDTTGSNSLDNSMGNIIVSITKQGETTVYVWLGDSRGNVDYNNYSIVVLRLDSQKPQIDSLTAMSPAYLQNWYNQKSISKFNIKVHFNEIYPKYVTITNPNYGESIIDFNPEISTNENFLVPFNTEGIVDGTEWFFVSVTDSAGNNSPADSIEINFDSTPPEITHQKGDSIVVEGGTYIVQATVKDVNHIESVELQHWRGGQRSKPFKPMTKLNDSTYQGIIPADFITSRGLEYAIIANDGLSNNRSPLWESKPSSYGVRVRINGENNTGLQKDTVLVVGDKIDAYRTISIPIDVDDKSAARIFEDNLGTYDPGVWRLFEWDTETAIFNEYPGMSDFSPGKAFWLITTIKNIVLDTGPGLSVDTSKPFVILLKKGWNDIGNPFNFEVAWEDIFIASAADTNEIIGPYYYNGSWQVGRQISIMKPWQGYSLYTESQDLTVLIPPQQAQTVLKKQNTLPGYNDILWALSIEAKNEFSADNANFIGITENASMEFDHGYDYVEPPGVGPYLSLYFNHPEWDMEAEKFTSDFRPPQDGHIWDFSVTGTNYKEPVTLDIHELTDLPPNLNLHLVDVDANISVNLNNTPTYSFLLQETKRTRHFKIIAGSKDFLDDHKEELTTVDTFELVQNYPNPFNGSTTIQYNLEKSMSISLSIYNLLGQKVRTIHSGIKEAGIHQFFWNATDDSGRELGTGIYILRIQTPDILSTKKMIYMR